MKKRTGPDLAPMKIETERCPDCARGFAQGMFYKMPCITCAGVGRIKDGKALPEQDAITLLRITLNEQIDENRKLRLKISELRDGESGRGYGAGGSRYHGD
ncbi:hypothetical protein HLV39_12320 [Marinobacter adhaerens]|uniref:Uncharacterized protein n=1 Tax=Marinobacter adhaerens TaxID=1033846 RepID=A0A851HXA1_9GAMM|nr:hypothetical protein [Marinobacter adhaerens]NWN92276.1 hypothetical protein [Marinobacter adhaerens]